MSKLDYHYLQDGEEQSSYQTPSASSSSNYYPANASGDSTSTLIRQRRVLSTAVEAYEIKLSSVATRLRELEESTKAKDEY
jgi:hypothetical protein